MDTREHNIEVDAKRQQTLCANAETYSKRVARIVSTSDRTKPEFALGVAADKTYQTSFAEIVTSLSRAKHVVLIGIGGSSLGIEAVYHAVALQTNPRLHVLDAIEPEVLTRMRELLESIEDPADIAICIISKSGNTTETITNATHFISACEDRFGPTVRERIVCIGTEGSEFLTNATNEGVHTASIPESIGGRYSVFTAVGAIPLGILRIDVTAFLDGAQKALEKAERDRSISHAAHLVALAEQGVHTVNFFTFNERLKILGFWWRQLLAESIGKEMTTDGATFSHQLLPTVASSVDLHSMTQLYLGGYAGMYTHFLYADTQSEHHALSDHWLMRHLTNLKGHTPTHIKDAIRKGVFQAYDDKKLPYRMTHLPKVTAYELGQFMATQMFEVMCLGALFNVDVFNQPNIESYKAHTRRLLAGA